MWVLIVITNLLLRQSLNIEVRVYHVFLENLSLHSSQLFSDIFCTHNDNSVSVDSLTPCPLLLRRRLCFSLINYQNFHHDLSLFCFQKLYEKLFRRVCFFHLCQILAFVCPLPKNSEIWLRRGRLSLKRSLKFERDCRCQKICGKRHKRNRNCSDSGRKLCQNWHSFVLRNTFYFKYLNY